MSKAAAKINPFAALTPSQLLTLSTKLFHKERERKREKESKKNTLSPHVVATSTVQLLSTGDDELWRNTHLDEGGWTARRKLLASERDSNKTVVSTLSFFWEIGEIHWKEEEGAGEEGALKSSYYKRFWERERELQSLQRERE